MLTKTSQPLDKSAARREPFRSFAMVPTAFSRDSRFPPIDKAIVADLLTYGGKNKPIVFPSQAKIAADLGVHRSTVNGRIKHLHRMGVISIIPKRKGRCNGYDLSTLIAMLSEATDRVTVNTMEPSKITTAVSENPTPTYAGFVEPDTNQRSDSDKHNQNMPRTADRVELSEPDGLQWGSSVADTKSHAGAAPAPMNGSGASRGGHLEAALRAEEDDALYRSLVRAADDLSLPTDDVPYSVESVKAAMERAIRHFGGEPFNRGTLERLIDDYGPARCWTQAIMLAERVLGNSNAVLKVTPFYMACIRTNSPKPRRLSQAERAAGYARLAHAGLIERADLPPELREQIEDKILELEIPF